MIFAVDVDYHGNSALAAGVLFQAWFDQEPRLEVTTTLSPIHAYIPGKFYQRELPCILQLLRQLDTRPEIIVVDGHVYLGAEHQPGLGKHLYDALEAKAAVIGVAKSAFKTTPEAFAVCRGGSQRPLYVSAVGIDEAVARKAIRTMAGEHRIPTLLKRVDHLCRGKV